MLLHQRQRPELVKYTHKTHDSFINHQSYTTLLKIWAAFPKSTVDLGNEVMCFENCSNTAVLTKLVVRVSYLT